MTDPQRTRSRCSEGRPAQRMLLLAKKGKHLGYVATKRSVSVAKEAQTRATSALWQDYNQKNPYEYHPGMYRRTFLNWDASPSDGFVPETRRIFVIWADDTPLPSVRKRGLDALIDIQEGIQVELITPANIQKWIVPQHPLHPAFRNLSSVHKSDYLRAYLLHHHGGGYSDVKAPLHHWGHAYRHLEQGDHWVLGYPERSTQWVAQLPRQLGRDLRRYYARVPGGSAYIARADTTLTREWLAEVERRLDYFAPLLEQNPGGVRNEVSAYPVSWNDLLAKIVHPLALKHHRMVNLRTELLPDLKSYR